MLVTGIVNTVPNNAIEIIDLDDPSYSCPNSLTFNPISGSSYLTYAAGGMVRKNQNDVPFICGGSGSSMWSECWQLLSR